MGDRLKRVAVLYQCHLYDVMRDMYGIQMNTRCRASFTSLNGICSHFIGQPGSTCRHIMDYIRAQHTDYPEEYETSKERVSCFKPHVPLIRIGHIDAIFQSLLLACKIDPNVVIVFNDDLMDIVAPSYQEIGRDLPRIIGQASLSLNGAVRCLLKADIILLSLSCMNVWGGHKMFFIVERGGKFFICFLIYALSINVIMHTIYVSAHSANHYKALMISDLKTGY